MSDNPTTLEDIIKAVEAFEPKTIFMNQKTYHELKMEIDFEPENVAVTNLLSDYQALVLSKRQMENMNKGFGVFKPWRENQ